MTYINSTIPITRGVMNVMEHVELFSPEQLAYLDNLYVKKDACTARHEKIAKSIADVFKLI